MANASMACPYAASPNAEDPALGPVPRSLAREVVIRVMAARVGVSPPRFVQGTWSPMTRAGSVPWSTSRSGRSGIRQGSVTWSRPWAGADRTVSGGSGQAMPSRSHPGGLGPQGESAKVHSRGADGAAGWQTVPQRSRTERMSSSP